MIGNYTIVQRKDNQILVVNGPWDANFASVVRANNISHIRLSERAGWHEADIGFLKQIPFLTGLDLISYQVRDFSPLYDLESLRELWVEGKLRKLSFERVAELPKLRALAIDGNLTEVDFTKFAGLLEVDLARWSSAKLSSIFRSQNLRRLSITGYSGLDLSEFRSLRSIESLGVGASRIRTLSGLSSCPELRLLSLTQNHKLTSLSGIEGCSKLQVLWVEEAKNLTGVDALSRLAGLRTLILSQCPRIESIRSIQNLPKLESVGLMQTTSIGDGDLSLLRTLPNLTHATFVDRRHYSDRSSQFPKKLPVYYGEDI